MPSDPPPPSPKKLNFFQRIAERYRWTSRRNKIGLWALLVALVLGGISLQWLQPAYRTTKMWIFLNMADEAIKRKDYNSASLAFRKALLSGQENPASWKALARFLDEVNSPELINVWDRLATMEPEVREHRYRQAQAALRFDRTYQAEEILDRLPADWRKTPECLRIEADVYMRKKQFARAEESLTKLLKVQPDNSRAAFDLISLRADDENLSTRTAARAELEQTAGGKSALASEALRKLIVLEQRDGNLDEADRLAGKLIVRPDSTLSDRIVHAQLEAMTNSFSLPITLANLRAYANRHPESFASILEWIVAMKLDPVGTAKWIADLPPELRANPQFEPALFQYYLGAGDWDRVIAILKNPQSVVHLPPAVMADASAALDLDRANDPSADPTWQRAIYAAEGQPRVLRVLSLLASARGWSSATGRALTALSEASPGDASVWGLLVQHENVVRNLPGLYKALSGLMQINPYDVNVASSWVLAAALVRQGEMDELLEIAKRTYESTNPSDARAATAYALALVRSKREKEALEIVDKMSMADRRDPQRAIYVGAVLAANGRKDEALEFFARSENIGVEIFSEERTLRRIWKGVAMGEASSAEEVEQILISRNDPDVQPNKISQEIQGEIQRRADPAEVQRIFQGLKTETEGRRKESPVEVEQILREARAEKKR